MQRALILGLLALSWASRGDAAPAAMDSAESIAAKVCTACHGADGNSTITTNPSLAGQIPEYLYKQLRDFKSGKRSNPIMAGMVQNLSEADMAALADYYAAKTPKQNVARDQQLVDIGQRVFRGGDTGSGVPACAGCHNPKGAGLPALFPRLAGQHAEYVAAQLNAYRVGGRANDDNSVMRTIASRMTDKEIRGVAEYISGLH
ncbi:MAG: c-type cytochrome [Burkholderiales bacterium]